MRYSFSLILIFAVVLTSCQRDVRPYHVGVSQCLDDAWRQKMNQEMERELLLHPEITLDTRIAHGSSALQCAQIDSFVAEKVDLLIVSPNEAEEVKPAVTRAFRAGIPVIVADRRVTGEDWTAFIGGDNYRVGELMGEWILSVRAEHKKPVLHVLEVCGLPGSTPATLRHAGMMHLIHNQAVSVETVEGFWMKEDAFNAVLNYLCSHPDVEVIVAQNDLMAIGAAEAVRATTGYADVRIMGVDGIQPGLNAIADGVIECSATYSSRGDMVIKTAVAILNDEPFVRDTILETTMIDAAAARALLIQSREHLHDLETLRFVQQRSDDLWRRMQLRTNTIVMGFVLVGLLVVLVLIYLICTHMKLRAEIKEEVVPQMADVMEALKLSSRDVAFSEQLRELVDAHLEDEELSVEFISRQLGFSRTQVFRRVKAVSGKGPLEYIRERRLIKADHLLHTTDMTVQQVANTFCFSTPAYFTKCYKKHFGHLPSAR